MKELISLAKSITGTILVIGFENENFVEILNKNNKIELFSHLSYESSNKKEKKKFFKGKTINIKKVYKELNKQQYDYVICDFEIVKSHVNNFIKNSYKLSNKYVYFVVDEDTYDYEEIVRRYSRYGAHCESIGQKGTYLVKVDIENMKINIIKRFLYSFRDISYNIIEFISSIIMS